mmetsp:Transcript_14616/g.13231  ORF Transcript_14616/g.13231 Transcript_14616/m.13231 type:complete len:234 (-) Transcript_14616:237-938(-)
MIIAVVAAFAPLRMSKMRRFCMIPLPAIKTDEELFKLPKSSLLIIFRSNEKLLRESLRKEEEKFKLGEDKIKLVESLSKITIDSYVSKLAIANTKLLKMQGNLTLRRLIEAYENTPSFKVIRSEIKGKKSRQALWTAVLDRDFEDFKTRMTINSGIRSTNKISNNDIASQIKDLYNKLKVSNFIHKPDDGDVVIIRKSQLYANEVALAECLCKGYPVEYEVLEEYTQLSEDLD